MESLDAKQVESAEKRFNINFENIKMVKTLMDHLNKGYTWKTVVDAFAEKDLGEDIALQNARLAKILTNDDYDWRAKQPILFTPSSDYKVDSGAGLQDKKA